ncbi:hypothetical protein TIFTF001_019904 [Ficus carica]|uniref:Uncharacterized protein n=1 Tax=Ficus carica TaxID=3494 RepID=A0AA88ATF4_FICCA|nr:hypothetical protein TIFTF001_019904 [Ficus carica]
MMVELFVLGCTGVVVFLHGANFFFHALTQHLTIRSLRFVSLEKRVNYLAISKPNIALERDE